MQTSFDLYEPDSCPMPAHDGKKTVRVGRLDMVQTYLTPLSVIANGGTLYSGIDGIYQDGVDAIDIYNILDGSSGLAFDANVINSVARTGSFRLGTIKAGGTFLGRVSGPASIFFLAGDIVMNDFDDLFGEGDGEYSTFTTFGVESYGLYCDISNVDDWDTSDFLYMWVTDLPRAYYEGSLLEAAVESYEPMQLPEGAYIGYSPCFTGNTPVLLASGVAREIDSLRVGDYVMSYDVDLNIWKPSRVDFITKHRHVGIVIATELDQDGEKEIVVSTPNHMFWNNSYRKWTLAEHLGVGDELWTWQSGHNKGGIIVDVSKQFMIVDVYNIHIEGGHVYGVGNSGILVLE